MKDCDTFVNFIYREKISGKEIAVEQVVVSLSKIKTSSLCSCAEVSESSDKISVSFENGKAVFEKSKGLNKRYAKSKRICM